MTVPDLQPETPKFEDVSDKFLGMSKSQFIGLLVGLLIFVVLLLGASLWFTVQRSDENRRAIAYLCETISTSDSLDKAAIVLEQNALDHHQVPPAQIQDTKDFLTAFRAGHERYLHNGACRQVSPPRSRRR